MVIYGENAFLAAEVVFFCCSEIGSISSTNTSTCIAHIASGVGMKSSNEKPELKSLLCHSDLSLESILFEITVIQDKNCADIVRSKLGVFPQAQSVKHA